MTESAFESARQSVGMRALNDLRRPRVLHPFMLAACPALALYGQNAATLPLSRIYPALAGFVVGTFVVWIVMARVCRDIHRAGVAASALLLSGFLAWPILETGIEWVVPIEGGVLIFAGVCGAAIIGAAVWVGIQRGGIGRLGMVAALVVTLVVAFSASPAFGRRAAVAIGIYLAASGLVVSAFLRYRGDSLRLTSSANVFGGALLALYAGYALLQERAQATLPHWPPEDLRSVSDAVAGAEVAALPDIYVFALDGYPADRVLRESLEYDNAPFMSKLESRSFVVAHNVRATEIEPVRALAACFNLAPVTDWLPETLSDGAKPHYIQRALEQNLLIPALTEQGYETIAFDSGIEALRPSHAFDRTLKPIAVLGEFERILFDRTIVARGLQFYFHVRYGNPVYWRFEPLRVYVEFVFDRMRDTAGDQPRFVYAYLPVPEPPFLFRDDGTRAYPYAVGPLDTARLFYDRDMQRQAFVEQLEYVNDRLLDTIANIQSNAVRPSVIVLMSLRGAALRGNASGTPPRAEVFVAATGSSSGTGASEPIALVEWFKNTIAGAAKITADPNPIP